MGGFKVLYFTFQFCDFSIEVRTLEVVTCRKLNICKCNGCNPLTIYVTKLGIQIETKVSIITLIANSSSKLLM